MRTATVIRIVAASVATLAAAAALSPAPAHGAENRVRDAAVLQANAGIEALTAGRWAEAVRELDAALPLARRAGDQRLIAACHRALGTAHDGLENYDAALEHYRAYLAIDVDEPLRRKTVQDRVLTLERMREAQVMITVDAVDAQLTIDGVPFEVSEEPIRLRLGRHLVRVTAPGFEPHEEEIAVTGGQTLQLAVRMRPLPGAARSTPRPPGDAPDGVHREEPAPSGVGVWPWLALGVGAVAGGVGTWLILDGTGDWQEAVDARGNPAVMSRDEAESLVERGQTKRTLGFVAGGVGAALIVTGIILLVTDDGGPEAPEAHAGPRLVPLLDAGSVGVGVSGGF